MHRLVPCALALVLTACGNGGEPRSTAPPTTAPPTTAPNASAPGSGTPAPSGGPGCPLLAAPAAGVTVVRVAVTGKTVRTDDRTVAVELNSTVRIEVTADVADEVHVHTYDERVETVPGCAVAVEFKADIPGTVEVELESAHLHLVEIRAS